MRFWLLVPAPIAYIAFMGSQVRFFGRWILPIAPMVALLAGVGALAIATFLLRSPVKARRPRALAVLFVILCAQGMVYSWHSTRELGRADTRTITRQWMFDHIPTGRRSCSSRSSRATGSRRSARVTWVATAEASG